MSDSIGTNLENFFTDARFTSWYPSDGRAVDLPKPMTREELNAAVNAQAALDFEQRQRDTLALVGLLNRPIADLGSELLKLSTL